MNLDRSTLIGGVAAIAAAVALVASSYQLNNYLLQVGTSLAMLAVLCLAWNIVGGYMGYPSLATIALFGLGVYVGAISQIKGIPMNLAWCLAALAGAVAAALLGAALLGLRGHYFAIGTIAAVEVLREIANNWDSLTGGAVGLNVPILRGPPDVVGRYFYLSMWALAGISLLVAVLIDRSSSASAFAASVRMRTRHRWSVSTCSNTRSARSSSRVRCAPPQARSTPRWLPTSSRRTPSI
jgi:branched-chain amino acid transport system permease protein